MVLERRASGVVRGSEFASSLRTMRSPFVAAVAALLIAAPAAGAAVPAGNLLANPGAEAGAGTDDGSGVAIPGWAVEGNLTAVKYGASNFITTEDGVRLGGGANFFAGGPSNETSAASQSVSVTSAATEIDAGGVTMTLSGLLGGWASQEDAVTVTATALDAGGAPLAT